MNRNVHCGGGASEDACSYRTSKAAPLAFYLYATYARALQDFLGFLLSNPGILATVVGIVVGIAVARYFYRRQQESAERMEEEHRKTAEEVKQLVFEREAAERWKKLTQRLVSLGAVPEGAVLKLIESQSLICIFTYGEGVRKTVLQLGVDGEPLKRQPLITLLGEMGFTRPGPGHNFFVIFAKSLPRRLRDPEALHKHIRRELQGRWKVLSGKVKTKYPEASYPNYLTRWKTPEGYDASYIIIKGHGSEFIVDYFRRIKFDETFQRVILGGPDLKGLRKVLRQRRHKIREFLSRISIDILAEDLDAKHRDAIAKSKNENAIRKSLGIRNFTDIRVEETAQALASSLGTVLSIRQAKAEEYAQIMQEKSQDYYDVLREIGVNLD